MSITITEPGLFRNRAGQIIEVFELSDCTLSSYPVRGNTMGTTFRAAYYKTWTINGVWKEGKQSGHDLVEELTTETHPELYI